MVKTTNEEIKAALMNEQAVIHNGIEYKRVSGIIYRKGEKGVYIQAELQDKNCNSVSIAEPERISFAGG